jgi:hypothetical protein
MKPRYYFTFQENWRKAPLAFWTHVPVPGSATETDPPAPEAIPHKGYLFLHVEVGDIDLVFSSPAQLDHFLEVMGARVLPTSLQLSRRRGAPVGPNSHWLSRLPATIKSPRQRQKVVRLLRAVREEVLGAGSPASWHIA